jgi:hypothetical protein
VGPSTPDSESIVRSDQYDVDGDGHIAADDCDDYDPLINPDATEVCDGVDNDCDDTIDEDGSQDALTWFIDTDDDGFGGSTTRLACELPDGFAANDEDCNDQDATFNPLASESCDGEDNDCDDIVDEGDDDDQDGFDDVCDGDCNDSDASINPDGTEICDFIDNDCNGSIDGPDASGTTPYWLDADGDGYGNPVVFEIACEPPLGYVQNDFDCDDGDFSVSPDAEEICTDFVDNDCDGTANDCDLEGTFSVSEAPWTILGSTEDANVGYAVAGADVNGDGWSDLLVGAMTESNAAGTQAGAAYLFLGPLTGSIETDKADAALLGPGANAQSGRVVAICDLDGDGQGDVITGAWNYEDQTGAAVVYLDPLADPDENAVIIGGEVGNKAGWAVACLGDVDGDGLADIAVGAVSNSAAGTEAGAVHIVLGPATGIATLEDAWATWTGESEGDLAGASVSGPGDLDGDGSVDLLIGASLEDSGGSNAGASYIVYGPLSSGSASLTTAEVKITGGAINDKAFNVSSPGDVDRDGVPDLIIGASWFNGIGTDRGAAYLLLGPVTADFSLASGEDAIWHGESDYDFAATSLAGAGDMNADGAADLIIGAYGDDALGAESGAAYIVYGPTRGAHDLTTAAVKLTGSRAGDYAGWSVSTVGDVNADGYDDVIIGAKFESTAYSKAGAAYVVLGSGL